MHQKATNHFTRKFWLGLALLFTIYSTYYLSFSQNADWARSHVAAMHAIKILVVFSIYLSGTYFLGMLPEKWLIQLWHLIHISLISLLMVLWIWHILFHKLPYNLLKLGYSTYEFLISPLLYLATGLTSWVSKEKK